MRVLITGAQGFVGRYVTGAISRASPDARLLGIGRSPRLDGYFSHCVTVQGTAVRAPVPEALQLRGNGRYQYERIAVDDATGVRALVDRFQPDLVIHLASGLRGDDSSTLVGTNIIGTALLLKAVGETRRKSVTVVLGSTGGVYGTIAPAELPVTETSPVRPADMYSATKLAAEQIGQVLCTKYGIRYVVARIFNIAGPGQSERHVCGRLAAALADTAVSPNPTLRVGYLSSTRDYVDVRDVASALLLLAESGVGTYNVASGVETSTGTILQLLSRYAGVEQRLRIQRIEGVPAGVPRHAGCPKRLTSLGYSPSFTVQESLEDVLDYYLEYGSREQHAP